MDEGGDLNIWNNLYPLTKSPFHLQLNTVVETFTCWCQMRLCHRFSCGLKQIRSSTGYIQTSTTNLNSQLLGKIKSYQTRLSNSDSLLAILPTQFVWHLTLDTQLFIQLQLTLISWIHQQGKIMSMRLHAPTCFVLTETVVVAALYCSL